MTTTLVRENVLVTEFNGKIILLSFTEKRISISNVKTEGLRNLQNLYGREFSLAGAYHGFYENK